MVQIAPLPSCPRPVKRRAPAYQRSGILAKRVAVRRTHDLVADHPAAVDQERRGRSAELIGGEGVALVIAKDGIGDADSMREGGHCLRVVGDVYPDDHKPRLLALLIGTFERWHLSPAGFTRGIPEI